MIASTATDNMRAEPDGARPDPVAGQPTPMIGRVGDLLQRYGDASSPLSDGAPGGATTVADDLHGTSRMARKGEVQPSRQMP